MKLKKFNLFVCFSFVVSGMFFYAKNEFVTNSNSLLLQNVEALSSDPEKDAPTYDRFTCYGQKYLYSAITPATITAIEHMSDSIDAIVRAKIVKCTASGRDHTNEIGIPGNNSVLGFIDVPTIVQLTKCNPLEHITIAELMYK